MSGATADADARYRAATDLSANLVVRAGAGTGKTSLLVERALNAVGSGHVELERLGAITFTEKAAGEMRQRLAEGLERLRALGAGERDASEANGPAERAYLHLTGRLSQAPSAVADRALAGIESLDRATVVTIHALCAQLLRAHPIEAGVDPGFAVDAGEHESTLREPFWREWIANEFGSDAHAGRDDAWAELIDRVPLDEIAALAGALTSFAVPIDLLDAPLPSPLEVYGERAARLAQELAALLDEPMSKTASGYVRDAHATLVGFAASGSCDPPPSLAGRLDAGRSRVFTSSKLVGVSQDEMNRRTDQAGRLIQALRTIEDEPITLALSLVAPFARAFREHLLASGFVSFDGLLALTRDLLRDHPDVRRRVKRRFATLFVDEFQDTDPLQYEIVLLLGEAPDDRATDAWRTRLEPGRLFVVGDAKQSIYRFRGADYEAFDRAVQRIVDAGGAALELTTNFRSVPGVLGPVNRLFDSNEGCWQASRQQPPYVPIAAHRADAANVPAVEVWTIADGRTSAHDRRELEGERIAEAIAGWVERDGHCRYRDVTILLRSFTPIAVYLRALRKLGVPFVVDGGREFLERPEVTQLLAILRAVARPWDQPSLLAYLRSAAGGCSDRELAAYGRDRGRWSWLAAPHADTAGHPAVGRALERMHDLAAAIRDASVDAAVREVVRRTQLLPLGAAAFEGPQRVANLEKLTAAAGELARDGRLSLEQVVEAIAEGRLEEIKADRPLADDAAEAVRISTIHRYKGLENRIVIVPDLARGPGRSDTPRTDVTLSRLDDGSPALAISLDGADNVVRGCHVENERLHSEAEETRVLYVALTRACDRLIVLGGDGRHPWLRALEAWGYEAGSPVEDGELIGDGSVLHRRPVHDATIGAGDQGNAGTPTEAAVAAFETARAACALAESPFRAPSAAIDDLARPAPVEPGEVPTRASKLPGARRSAAVGRAAGSLLHLALERVDPADPDSLASIAQRWTNAIADRHGVDPETLASAVRPVLDGFPGSSLADRLREATIVGRELPMLLSCEDGRRFRGTIDLLYRDAAGEWIVADYKTDAEDDVDTLRGRYSPQMAIYRDAVQRALELERLPRGELWLLRHGRLITLDPAGP